MFDPGRSDSAGERLESWKEIAAYLKRDVRTARRWEKHEGLPVHRHVHHKLASVYAFKQELDGWRANREAPTTPQIRAEIPAEEPPSVAAAPQPLAWRLIAVAIAAVAIAGALAALGPSRRAAPSPAPATADRVPSRLLATATGEGQRPAIVTQARVTALVMSADGTHLYFTERDRRVLRILETRSNRIAHTVTVPGRPNQLALSPDGLSAYIATEEGDVLRLDLQRRTFETLARGLSPALDLALTEDGGRLYVTAVFNGLHVLDTRTRKIQTIPTVRCPMYVAIVPGKDLAYISYQCGGPGGRRGHDAIDVRVASTGAAKTTVTGPPQVGGEIRASLDGGQIWVDGKDACISPEYDRLGCPAVPAGVINVYRVDDNYLLGSLALPGATAQPGGFVFFRDRGRVLVGGPTLKVVDTRSLSVVEEAPLPATGRAAFSPDGHRAYIALTDGHIAVFDDAGGRCVPPPAQLASWWTADGHANDVREDNPGELRNGATIAPGWVGQGFQLNGRGAHVHIASVSVDERNDFSAAVWMKPSTTGRAEVILEYGHVNMGWKLMRNADGSLSFCDFTGADADCAPGETVRTAAVAPPDRWTHVVAVAAGRRLSLFVQGHVSGSAERADRPGVQRHDFRIGGSFAGEQFFEGLIDEVQLFRQALTPGEVRRLVDAGRYGLCYR